MSIDTTARFFFIVKACLKNRLQEDWIPHEVCDQMTAEIGTILLRMEDHDGQRTSEDILYDTAFQMMAVYKRLRALKARWVKG